MRVYSLLDPNRITRELLGAASKYFASEDLDLMLDHTYGKDKFYS